MLSPHCLEFAEEVEYGSVVSFFVVFNSVRARRDVGEPPVELFAGHCVEVGAEVGEIELGTGAGHRGGEEAHGHFEGHGDVEELADAEVGFSARFDIFDDRFGQFPPVDRFGEVFCCSKASRSSSCFDPGPDTPTACVFRHFDRLARDTLSDVLRLMYCRHNN